MRTKNLQFSTLWRLFDFLRPKRGQYFVSLFVVAAIFSAERLFAGWIVKLFTDAIANRDMRLLLNTVLYWGGFAVGLMAVSPLFLYSWRSSILQGVANLRQSVFSHLQRLPLGYYESRHSGEAMSIITNDVAAAEGAYQDNLLNLVQSLLQAVSAAIFMLILKWDLALLIIASGVAPLIINALFAKRLRLIGQETQEKLAGQSERLADLLAGFQVVRTFNLGGWILQRFSRSNDEVLGANLKRVRIESGLAAANEFGGLLTLFSFGLGAYMVLNGQITLGTLFGLIQLNNPVSNCFLVLGNTIASLQAALAAGDRLLAVLDAAPEPERYPAVTRLATNRGLNSETAPLENVPFPDGLLSFQDVQFSYGDGRPVLQDLSFTIQEGQVAAFVGPSGSGKSTVFRLLMGHYPVQAGGINLMGKPLHAYSLSELRDLFAFVPQDAFLYSGTIQENIRFGKEGASELEVIAAAQASNAHDFILDLPQGYSTLVGERGARLSGGQRQRIAIARALLKNAPILLLDEATSALDSESEELVQKALEVLMKGRTTLAIAHRLSTIENAGVIYVLSGGKVVQQGRHAELINDGGLYRGLYELQFNDTGLVQAGEMANE